MAGKKYYVVWKGVKPGIYDDWKECERQVKGFEGARYKSYSAPDEARRAFERSWQEEVKKRVSNPMVEGRVGNPVGPIWESLSVDAACSGNPGRMEYRGVMTRSGRQIFHKGPFPLGTNNIGEFLGIVHGLAYLKKHNSDIPVYSDSKTALKWIRDKAVKTKLPRNQKTEELFDLIDRAIGWLNTNTYSNPVLKWDTENWGEIPADFGRK